MGVNSDNEGVYISFPLVKRHFLDFVCKYKHTTRSNYIWQIIMGGGGQEWEDCWNWFRLKHPAEFAQFKDNGKKISSQKLNKLFIEHMVELWKKERRRK